MHRFCVTDLPAMAPLYTLEGAPAHQIASVLRLRAGEYVELFDGQGLEVLCTLAQVSERRVLASPVQRRQHLPTEPQLHLYPALLRGPRFELVLQKATELGVASITPVVSQRCVAHVTQAGVPTRWQHVVSEAAEQCERSTLPVLSAPIALAQACALAARVDLALCCSEHGGAALLDLMQSQPRSISVLVGPEGGFEDAEFALAASHGLHACSLGPLVLRAETASLAACAAVQCLSGVWAQARQRWPREAVAS
jgi:16S rRNA (uracil1498-N3)-methyltransferase